MKNRQGQGLAAGNSRPGNKWNTLWASRWHWIRYTPSAEFQQLSVVGRSRRCQTSIHQCHPTLRQICLLSVPQGSHHCLLMLSVPRSQGHGCFLSLPRTQPCPYRTLRRQRRRRQLFRCASLVWRRTTLTVTYSQTNLIAACKCQLATEIRLVPYENKFLDLLLYTLAKNEIPEEF